jgi:transposase
MHTHTHTLLGNVVARSYNTATWWHTSVSALPTGGSSHYLICDCAYNFKISVPALNSNSIREQCFAKMDVYTFQEMADMHLIYGRAYGNSREARRRYQQNFLQRHLPHRQTFVNINRRLRETGTFQPVTANWGRPLSVQTPNLEENILHLIEQDPAGSTRRIAAVERVSHMTVWRVVHRQLLYPYHLQRVQGLGSAGR